MNCTSVTKGKKERAIKLAAARNSDAKRDNDNSTKSGKAARRKSTKNRATFAAVEDDSESEDNKEPSNLPTYEEYLRSSGVIQLNVGAEKTWDGDSVSEFGFGCLHVGRARASPEPNGVVFAGAGDKLVGSPNKWIS